jgi:hypothetical protein
MALTHDQVLEARKTAAATMTQDDFLVALYDSGECFPSSKDDECKASAFRLLKWLNHVEKLLHEELEYLGRCAIYWPFPTYTRHGDITDTRMAVRRQADRLENGRKWLQKMLDDLSEDDRSWLEWNAPSDFEQQLSAHGIRCPSDLARLLLSDAERVS